MELAGITPVIITFNESPNIRRTLERLQWASSILVIDSFSTDDTLSILAEFPNVRVMQRPFVSFADQCNFALQNVGTPWTLSLDADYICPTSLADELVALDKPHDGYAARFRYCIYGHPLRGTLYPPRTVLYRTAKAAYEQDGHAHRVHIDGSIGRLNSVIDHDDQKPLSRWLKSQESYASREADKILAVPARSLRWKDRLRRNILCAPVLTAVYCLFLKRLILDGWPGLFYTLQRVYAELLLSLKLLDRRLCPEVDCKQ